MTTETRLRIPASELAALRERLASTRLPNVPEGSDPKGFPLARVRTLLEAWPTFDWEAVESRLDAYEQHLVPADGVPVHVLRARGGDRVPVVVLHGWADSLLGPVHLIPHLTAAGHDVVIPTPPGYGISGQPAAEMSVESSAETIAQALAELGIDRYALHGGDFGAALAEAIALAHPDRVVGIHLTDPSFAHAFAVDAADAKDDAERAFLQAAADWTETSGYFAIQSTQPLTLAYALADSPVGLLAWLAEKRWAWTDRDPSIDDVLGLATLYWCTGTAYSSMRLYAEGMGDWSDESWGDDAAGGTWGGEADATGDAAPWGADADADSEGSWGADAGGWQAPVCQVPAAFAIMPSDILQHPRSFCERFYGDIRRFTLMPAGGHFATADEPEALSADIVAFLADL